MRDLLFKNLTSNDKKRKIIATSEIVEKAGIRSIIQRHFICIAKEINNERIKKPSPYLYVLKETQKKEYKEKFFCKIKGSIYAVTNGRLFLILFMHTLKINLQKTGSDLFYPEK